MRSEGGQTIGEHVKLIKEHGEVYLAKMGKAIGPALANDLLNQIEDRKSTFLFITIREGWNGGYVTYKCPLKGIYSELDDDDMQLVPEYYAHERKQILFWTRGG